MLRFTKWVAVLALLFFPLSIHAEPPPELAIHGVLADADGVLVDGEVQMTFNLYPANSTTAVHTEAASVRVTEGGFVYYLGSAESLDMSLFRDNSELEVGITVGSDAEMTPRLRLSSVPFAAMATYASTAMTLDGKTADDFLGSDSYAAALDEARFDAQARAVCEDVVSDVFDNQIDGEFVRHGEADSITNDMVTNLAVTGNKIAAGAVTQEKLGNRQSLYRVTSPHCSLPVEALTASSGCLTRPVTADDNCGFCLVPQRRYITCDGTCSACTFLSPRCPNTLVGHFVGNVAVE